MVAWSAAWLFVLGAPASEVWRGHTHPAALAGGMLLSFAGLYLVLWWVVTDRESRLRLRLALLGGLTVLALISSLAFHGAFPYLFFFVSVSMACAFPRKLAFFAILAVTGLDTLVMSQPAQHPLNGQQIFGVAIAGLVALFIMRMVQLIRELNAAREEVARLAVAGERVRFARDLHDLLGHTLSLIVVKSEAVRRLLPVDAEAAARESSDIETVSRQALAEVREAVTNYRDRSLDAEVAGARAALTAAGIEATVNLIADRLPESVESVLGWTVREGVTNVVRHSNGRHCAIEMRQGDGIAVLEICDDGDASGATRDMFRDPGRQRAHDGESSSEPAPARKADRSSDPAPELKADRSSNSIGAVNAGADSEPSRWSDDQQGSEAVPVLSGIPGNERATLAEGGLGADSDGVSRSGSGLRGLAERLAQAHGKLEAGRRSDGGFRLAVTVPLHPDGRDSV